MVSETAGDRNPVWVTHRIVWTQVLINYSVSEACKPQTRVLKHKRFKVSFNAAGLVMEQCYSGTGRGGVGWKSACHWHQWVCGQVHFLTNKVFTCKGRWGQFLQTDRAEGGWGERPWCCTEARFTSRRSAPTLWGIIRPVQNKHWSRLHHRITPGNMDKLSKQILLIVAVGQIIYETLHANLQVYRRRNSCRATGIHNRVKLATLLAGKATFLIQKTFKPVICISLLTSNDSNKQPESLASVPPPPSWAKLCYAMLFVWGNSTEFWQICAS